MLRAKATIDAFPIDENVLEMQIGPSPCILFFTNVTASKQLCTLNQAALGCPLMFSTFLISGADRPRGYPSGTSLNPRKHIPA